MSGGDSNNLEFGAMPECGIDHFCRAEAPVVPADGPCDGVDAAPRQHLPWPILQ